MNVYVLIEEIEQEDYICNGEKADPVSLIVGVYEDREKAEREKDRLSEASAEDVRKFNADPCSYIIEERPLL